ncbi:MAG: hypothetical protein M1308_17235 [Actinobacteria bacterium]|nr:hypothetical protein [Actinomycetota bacterium]
MDNQEKFIDFLSTDFFIRLMEYKYLNKQRLNTIITELINGQIPHDFYYVFKRESLGTFVQITIHISSNATVSFIFPFTIDKEDIE